MYTENLTASAFKSKVQFLHIFLTYERICANNLMSIVLTL